jgi:exonuclease SbcD
MRILATGDCHFSERSRFAECVRMHQWFVDLARQTNPDLVLIPGDVFDTIASDLDFDTASDVLAELCEVSPVIVCQGNHDHDKDFADLGKLRRRDHYRGQPIPYKTKHQLIVERTANVHYIAGAAVAAIAWPKKGVLLAGLAENLSQEQAAAIAVDELQNIFRGLGAQLREFEGPKVAMGHLMILGSRVSTGQPVVPSADFTIGLADLGLLSADVVICSHIHKPQDWLYGKTPIIYCGTSYATTYGETEQKSVLLVDLDGHGGVKWERIPSPATKMVQLVNEWKAGDWLQPVVEDVSSCDVRFRYMYDAEDRDAAKASARAMESMLRLYGAVDVKLDPVERPTLRARAPQITAAFGTKEKLEVLWSVKGPMPDEERKQRLFAKAEMLEAEIEVQ